MSLPELNANCLPRQGDRLSKKQRTFYHAADRHALSELVSVAKSQIVILSEAKDLENHGDSSLRSE
jgi:hypothetical protein